MKFVNFIAKMLSTAAILLFASLFITSCADSKKLTIDGKELVAEPYGWGNEEAQKVEGVVYEVSAGNVIWSIILCETIIAPVYLTGWELYEPVKVKQ